MKSRTFVWLSAAVAAALWVAACAPQARREAPPVTAAERLFRQAESAYGQSSFSEALVLYQDYLARYPQGRDAAAALMRVGGIHARAGDAALARRAFSKVISDHPDSPLRSEAMTEILYALYRDRHYQEVVQGGPEALRMAALPAQRYRVFSVIGDSHMGLEQRIPAVVAYMQALKLADASEQQSAAAKLKQALLHLSSGEVAALIERPADDLPLDYLLFQAGMLLAQEGRFSDAMALLTAFRKRFPGHDHGRRAEEMLDEIQKSARYERHVFGCLLPLTGSYQSIGQRVVRGIELALKRHNAREGAPPVEMIIKDTGSDPQRTIQALEELAREDASAVIGPLVHAEAAAREAQRLGIPMITITQRDNVVGLGSHVFRNFITPRAQVRALVAYAIEKVGVSRAVILYPDENYGRTFAALFREAFEAGGGEVLASSAYGTEAVDFSAMIKRLLRFSQPVARETGGPRPSEASRRRRAGEDKPELVFDFQAIFIPDEPQKVGMLASQLAYFDIKDLTLLGTNLWHSEALLRLAQPYVQGAIFPDAFFADSGEPAVREFVEAFKASYQERPGFMEAIVYDTAMILFQTVSRPDVRYRGDIAAALTSSQGFSGATGFTRFEKNGDADKTLHVLQVRGKKFIEVE
jgi:ABC-type branched-subunit amino acid transport system substrate-binding protein